ncbi:hypothetical protein IWZ03DRAFT_164172 [Phyllosticta citriasiana]|uniref:Transmembrane protein n=1 Tax=Phyllosticta citriasiana TaxID=595635 RepID=A0ABR1KSF6_9PEZI
MYEAVNSPQPPYLPPLSHAILHTYIPTPRHHTTPHIHPYVPTQRGINPHPHPRLTAWPRGALFGTRERASERVSERWMPNVFDSFRSCVVLWFVYVATHVLLSLVPLVVLRLFVRYAKQPTCCLRLGGCMMAGGVAASCQTRTEKTSEQEQEEDGEIFCR